MENTQFRVEDVFGDVIKKEIFSQEQITKLNNFLAKMKKKININIKISLFKPRKKTNIEPSAPPYYEKFLLNK